MREYYKAYDDRYQQIHSKDLTWFHENPSEIVLETMKRYCVGKDAQLLEIGCGEGRDAFFLLEQGYPLLATDVSDAAIRYCKTHRPEFTEAFRTVDCLKETLGRQFDFIFAVAVVHMLVPDADRRDFYRFIRDHLKEKGTALICTMGDGIMERQTDIRTAFDLQTRIHEQTGREVHIAGTSCRMVSFETLSRELTGAGLNILETDLTSIEPDFPSMMYAVVQKDILEKFEKRKNNT